MDQLRQIAEVPSSELKSFNPVTGEVIGSYHNFTAPEVHAIVERAHQAATVWSAMSFRSRRKILNKWAATILRNSDDFASWVSKETGKPLSDAGLEVQIAASHITWAANNAERYLISQRRASGILLFNLSTKVERVPMGVVGVIGPWNYPVFIPMGSIAYALAAGNAVVFKPSEFTPGVGKWLEKTFREVCDLDGLFSVITGTPETGKALTESSINKLSFTGSTRTAKKVAQACAERMIPVLLECGGKDPVLIAPDANISKAAEETLWCAMANAGQSCIGAERVYVHESVAEVFIKEISEMARKLVPGRDYGPATMPAQLNVIQNHIDDAAKTGGKFIVGNPDSVKPPFVEPVIIVDVPEDSTSVTDETFGPVLIINRTQTMEEAITKANATRYGLGASVWSRRHGRSIASKLECGMVAINAAFSFAAIASAPFGGYKDSGSGRIHGPEGLLEFTYARTIVKKRFSIPIGLTTFQRKPSTDRLIKRLMILLHGRG
jgi:acyl-CoA reductase-like NAD-dependent aldehyde dehydrogenase